jgi:hypothetical protein
MVVTTGSCLRLIMVSAFVKLLLYARTSGGHVKSSTRP